MASDLLPARVRDLLELVLELMDMGAGRWRLEVLVDDGRVTQWWRHEGPGAASALARFDERPS